jgi:hypothetical protein
LTNPEGRSDGDPDALAELALNDFDLFKRSLAALQLGSANARSVLTALLAWPDPRVRANTVDAVAEIGGDSSAVCELIACLGEDDHEIVRNAAIEAMAALGCSGEALLSASSRETSRLVLASLAEAIGRLGFSGGRERLRQLAEHEDPAVRGYAVASLGLLHSTVDRAFLESLAPLEHSSRVLAPLHVALYSFDGAFAVQVSADLRSGDPELVALTLRELSFLAGSRARPRWLDNDGDIFVAVVGNSSLPTDAVAGELALFRRTMSATGSG